MYYTNKMTKQHGLGNYGKQRIKDSMARLSDKLSDKEIKLWTILGYLPKDEQKQTK
jgi:hypothetical protein